MQPSLLSSTSHGEINLTFRIPKDLIKSEWENAINALYAITKPQDHLLTKHMLDLAYS